jgi:hypothetical protein
MASNNYNTGTIVVPEVAEGFDIFAGPIFGVFRLGGEETFDSTKNPGNLYAPGCAPAQTEFLVGSAVDAQNHLEAVDLLGSILVAASVDEEIRYNVGGYPVPESLWDGIGEEPVVPGLGQPVTYRFNIAPAAASVEVRDADGAVVAADPDDAKAFELTIGSRYSYTVSASGYNTAQADFLAYAPKTVTVSLALTDPGQYVPGWNKWRPSFGIYITNRDGSTGTRIGSWVFDEALRTYVDPATGLEPAFIETFSQPVVYSGKDMMPAARLGVVTKGINAAGVIAYYNAYVEAHPELGLEYLDEGSVEDFSVLCATSSDATEDPYASNDPAHPGQWAWTGWDDSLTGVARYYYKDFLKGVNNGTAVDTKALGEGTEVPALLAVRSYEDRIMRLPASVVGSNQQIDDEAELAAAVAYLLSVADDERALRNFTGMLPDNSTHPLGADDSYYVGSVWITPGYHEITSEVVGEGSVNMRLVSFDTPRAAAGETVSFKLDDVTEGKAVSEVKANGVVLSADASGIYSFVMPNASTVVTITLTDGVQPPGVGAPGSGDFNGDGEATLNEALLLVQFINNDALDTLSDAQFAALDINGDGQLTMADVLLIVQIVLNA